MVRTQIQFHDEQLTTLRSRAAREGISISALVRQAVDAWVKGDVTASPEDTVQRALDVSGRFASGRHNVAREHDAYLADSFRR